MFLKLCNCTSRRGSAHSIDKPCDSRRGKKHGSWDDVYNLKFDDIGRVGCVASPLRLNDRWTEIDKAKSRSHCCECETLIPRNEQSRELLYFPRVSCRNGSHAKGSGLSDYEEALNKRNEQKKDAQRSTILKLPPVRVPSPTICVSSAESTISHTERLKLLRRKSLSPTPTYKDLDLSSSPTSTSSQHSPSSSYKRKDFENSSASSSKYSSFLPSPNIKW